MSIPSSVRYTVSVLFNEPKLLKSGFVDVVYPFVFGFSALQRAEIAEIDRHMRESQTYRGFSALQRAEIAEIRLRRRRPATISPVSVLFNEPKLLK